MGRGGARSGEPLGRPDRDQRRRTNLLHRYWWPIGGSSKLAQPGTLPVRLLGENLVLYKDLGGRLGPLDRRCEHRRADLSHG